MIQFLIIAIIGQHYLTISEQNFCVNKAQVYPMKVSCLIAHKLQVVWNDVVLRRFSVWRCNLLNII